jgi:hypothetical protein
MHCLVHGKGMGVWIKGPRELGAGHPCCVCAAAHNPSTPQPMNIRTPRIVSCQGGGTLTILHEIFRHLEGVEGALVPEYCALLFIGLKPLQKMNVRWSRAAETGAGVCSLLGAMAMCSSETKWRTYTCVQRCLRCFFKAHHVDPSPFR